jgi:hypothetical protein
LSLAEKFSLKVQDSRISSKYWIFFSFIPQQQLRDFYVRFSGLIRFSGRFYPPQSSNFFSAEPAIFRITLFNYLQ